MHIYICTFIYVYVLYDTEFIYVFTYSYEHIYVFTYSYEYMNNSIRIYSA